MLVMPADHIIQMPDEFHDAILKGISLAESNKLVTFGIQPDKAETGYGYIKAGDEFVIVWQGKGQDVGPPTDSWGVYGQRYTSGINSAPVVTLAGDALDYTENDPATVIDAGATVTDADSPDFDMGALSIDFTGGGTLNDRLAILNTGTGPGQIGVAGSDITYEGTVIGSFSGGTDGLTPLSITFNSSANTTAVQQLLRHITYRNVSDDPATGSRTLRIVMDDGDVHW